MDITQPFEPSSLDSALPNGNLSQQEITGPDKGNGETGQVWDVGRYARQDMDRETTRYLSAATQLNVDYAQRVVGSVVGEPFRAVAPTYGADVAVVARWAVDSVLRRSRRDMSLFATLTAGVVIAWLAPAWPVSIVAVIVAMFICAWVIVSLEYWKRTYRVVVGRMLKDNFVSQEAPEPSYDWVRKRIAAVSDRRRGNLIVFRGQSAFVGSGGRLSREHIVIDVSRGRKIKNGKPQKPQKFTNADVHCALLAAMRKIGFADIHVEERLFVNGRHIKGSDTLLPHGEVAPPASYVSPSLLKQAVLHPTPDARAYVCVEMPGWQGQLIVTLFARAVHAGGSLYIEWEYHVLPPLGGEFLNIDLLYGTPLSKQMLGALIWGAVRFVPALFKAPFLVVRDLHRMITVKRRSAFQKNAIEKGQEYDYGASESIRESACGTSRQHYFLARDEIMYVLMSQQILVREVRAFLRKQDVSLGEFDIQVKAIKEETFKFYNIHLGNVSNSAVVIGDKSSAQNKRTQP
ncbi:MAG: hypothetical protein M3Z75_11105 [Actinomycetota bacterium]|nr:hypothetical protein [Actinomycetota bacterium]